MAWICRECGNELVETMEQFWKNPSYSCPRDLARTECNDDSWVDLHCAQGTIARLKSRLALAEELATKVEALGSADDPTWDQLQSVYVACQAFRESK